MRSGIAAPAPEHRKLSGFLFIFLHPAIDRLCIEIGQTVMSFHTVSSVIINSILRNCLREISLNYAHAHMKHLHDARLVPRQELRIGEIKAG